MTNADIKKLFADGKTAADIKKMVEAAEKEYLAEQEEKRKAAAAKQEKKAKVRVARIQVEEAICKYIAALTGAPVSAETQKEIKDYLDRLENIVERFDKVEIKSTKEKKQAGSDSWIDEIMREFDYLF